MCAVVGPGQVAAVEGQTRKPDEVVVDPHVARRSRASWFWLVDDSVTPEPRALEQLLALLDRWEKLPPPALLASKIVGPDGSPDELSLPVPRMLDDRNVVVAAFERHALPIRIARAGSLLVAGRAIASFGLLPAGQDLTWTARLLKHDLGLLVPASIGVGHARQDGLELGAWLKLLSSSALRRSEKPLLALRIAEALLRQERIGR